MRGRSRRGRFPRAVPDLSPALDRVVEQRYSAALAQVSRVRREHPEASNHELVARLIRQYAKDMAIGGALSGGAAAAPFAGVAVIAASAGMESAAGVARLGEMIMAIGVLYGDALSTHDERRTAVLAVMAMADGAVVGVSGLAARAGTRGGTRLIRRLPGVTGAAASGGLTRRTLRRFAGAKGPWGLTTLVPYGIGAGVGAAGNALLTRAVGRAAKDYYDGRRMTDEDLFEEALIEDDLVDAEFVDEVIIDVPEPPSAN